MQTTGPFSVPVFAPNVAFGYFPMRICNAGIGKLRTRILDVRPLNYVGELIGWNAIATVWRLNTGTCGIDGSFGSQAAFAWFNNSPATYTCLDQTSADSIAYYVELSFAATRADPFTDPPQFEIDTLIDRTGCP